MNLKDYLYYQDDWATIYCGDCLEVMKYLSPVDAVITDPPYNNGKNYGEFYNDNMEDEAYIMWLTKIWKNVPSETLIYTPGDKHLWDTRQICLGAGFSLARPLAWHKKEFAGDKFAGGPAISWEPIIWAYKNQKNFNRIYGIQGRDFLVVESIHGNPIFKYHPCPKPIEIYSWLINLFTKNNLLDPFLGSGTTCVAAKNLNRKSIGIEINPDYCEIAVKRLRQEVFDFGKH